MQDLVQANILLEEDNYGILDNYFLSIVIIILTIRLERECPIYKTVLDAQWQRLNRHQNGKWNKLK